MIQIANLPNRCIAFTRKLPDFTGRHAHLDISAFFSHHLSGCAGGPNKLSALSRHEFQIMNHRAFRDLMERQGISDLNIGIELFAGINSPLTYTTLAAADPWDMR